VTNRYKNLRNAVVKPPFEGKHRKTEAQAARRHAFNARINRALSVEAKEFLREIYRNSRGVYRRAY